MTSSTRLTITPEGTKTENRGKERIKQIFQENSSELNNTNFQIESVKKNKIKRFVFLKRHVYMKFRNIKDKNKMLKAPRGGKNWLHFKSHG